MTEINKKDQDLCLTKDLNVIKEGLDIDGYCNCGYTPIHYHANEDNFDIVKYLLSKGADSYKKSIYGEDISNYRFR